MALTRRRRAAEAAEAAAGNAAAADAAACDSAAPGPSGRAAPSPPGVPRESYVDWLRVMLTVVVVFHHAALFQRVFSG